jgi:hypothetical protein
MVGGYGIPGRFSAGRGNVKWTFSLGEPVFKSFLAECVSSKLEPDEMPESGDVGLSCTKPWPIFRIDGRRPEIKIHFSQKFLRIFPPNIFLRHFWTRTTHFPYSFLTDQFFAHTIKYLKVHEVFQWFMRIENNCLKKIFLKDILREKIDEIRQVFTSFCSRRRRQLSFILSSCCC